MRINPADGAVDIIMDFIKPMALLRSFCPVLLDL